MGKRYRRCNGQQNLDSALGAFLSGLLKCGGLIAVGRMDALGVVEVDVFFGDPSDFIRCFEREALLGFGLEATEETLHDRIIAAIATTAHAGRDAHGVEALWVGRAGVLTAWVGVEQKVGLRVNAPQEECLIQRRQGQLRVGGSGQRSADDLAGIEIPHHGKRHPACCGAQVTGTAGHYFTAFPL